MSLVNAYIDGLASLRIQGVRPVRLRMTEEVLDKLNHETYGAILWRLMEGQELCLDGVPIEIVRGAA